MTEQELSNYNYHIQTVLDGLTYRDYVYDKKISEQIDYIIGLFNVDLRDTFILISEYEQDAHKISRMIYEKENMLNNMRSRIQYSTDEICEQLGIKINCNRLEQVKIQSLICMCNTFDETLRFYEFKITELKSIISEEHQRISRIVLQKINELKDIEREFGKSLLGQDGYEKLRDTNKSKINTKMFDSISKLVYRYENNKTNSLDGLKIKIVREFCRNTKITLDDAITILKIKYTNIFNNGEKQ